MRAAPKVSVVMPTYNYGRFLDEAIQSVLDQTFTDFEFIIVDNRSTDNTAEVVQKYLSDPRVSFVVNEQNLGLVGNWNRCLELARGEYIKFLCADDKFLPRILERFVQVLDEHPNVALVSTYNQLFGKSNKVRQQPFCGLVSGALVRNDLLQVGARNYLNNPSVVMFRRSSVQKAGRFNPLLHNMLDKEYYVRLLATGDCYIIPEVLCCVRSHTASQSSAVKKQTSENTLEVYRYFQSIYQAALPVDAGQVPKLKGLVKERAIQCGYLMYRLLPGLHRPENWKLFKKAFEIAYSEKVVIRSLKQMVQRKLAA